MENFNVVLRDFLPLVAAALLSGCQTPHQFATPDGTWQTHLGQLKYSDANRTLIGDVVVRQRGAEEFQLDFQKVGGIPLLMLRADATTARAEGLFARGSWQGTPASAPPHLRNWVALREVFRKPYAGGAGATWQDEATKFVGGKLSQSSVTFSPNIENPTTEYQSFSFQFNR